MFFKELYPVASRVVQGLGIHVVIQVNFTSLIPVLGISHMLWSIPQAMWHNHWSCTLEPVSCNYWAHMLSSKKPPQWEAHAELGCLTIREARTGNKDPAEPINKPILFLKELYHLADMCVGVESSKQNWMPKKKGGGREEDRGRGERRGVERGERRWSWEIEDE